MKGENDNNTVLVSNWASGNLVRIGKRKDAFRELKNLTLYYYSIFFSLPYFLSLILLTVCVLHTKSVWTRGWGRKGWSSRPVVLGVSRMMSLSLFEFYPFTYFRPFFCSKFFYYNFFFFFWLIMITSTISYIRQEVVSSQFF